MSRFIKYHTVGTPAVFIQATRGQNVRDSSIVPCTDAEDRLSEEAEDHICENPQGVCQVSDQFPANRNCLECMR